MLDRKIAAETKLLTNAYLKLPRAVQMAQLQSMHEMALKFGIEPAAPELSQPLPSGARRTVVTDPPGMPLRRFNIMLMRPPAPNDGKASTFEEQLRKKIEGDSGNWHIEHYLPKEYLASGN